MNERQKQMFKEILIDGDYLPFLKGNKNRETLERACLTIIQDSDGALFHRDFAEPLTERINELYQEEKILTQFSDSWSKWIYRDYENKIERRRTLEEATGLINALVTQQLITLRRPQPRNFSIYTVYELLKEYMNFSSADRLSLNPIEPKTREEVIEIFRKARELGNKSMGHEPENFDEAVKKLSERLKEESEEWYREYRWRNIAGGYKSALGNATLAYTSLDSAIQFLSPYLALKPEIGRNVIFKLK